MRSLRRLSALLLLATLVAGGMVTPELHRIEHARANALLLVDHAAGGEHHHHTTEPSHGVELGEVCPIAPASELSCAVCQGLSAHVATAAPPAPGLSVLAWTRVHAPEAFSGSGAPAADARGPPRA